MALNSEIMRCREQVLSEDYLDIILDYLYEIPVNMENRDFCYQQIDALYASAYLNTEEWPPYGVREYGFRRIPSLFSLQDTGAVSASGILQAQNLPGSGLKGQGVLIGFIDTGIDYTHPAFRNSDGSTRIKAIWDQTIQSDQVPMGFYYGTEYEETQINEALRSAEPFSVVPSRDRNGHGTFIAGLAAGSESPDGTSLGAAPEAVLAMVKLKPAKQNLRDYYFTKEDAEVYQENDIMLGIRYLQILQVRLQLPMVICLGLGTNRGGHDGRTPLEELLYRFSAFPGCVPVVCTGNDGNESHHYYGAVAAEADYTDVEIRIPAGEGGFRMDLWAQTPEAFSVSVQSPRGERSPVIPPRVDRSDEYTFVLEPTRLFVDYSLAEFRSGSQLISVGLEAPTEGIWILRVYNAARENGYFHIWLPIGGQLEPDTGFLRPDPEVTLAIPSTSPGAITIGGYDYRNNSFYINSGRGYTRLGDIKPSIAAPCVELMGPIPGGRYGTRSGTSLAAAITAGAAADLLTWGVVQGNQRNMDTNVIRSYLIRGANRIDGFFYPNPETGYGNLDLYGVFRKIISY